MSQEPMLGGILKNLMAGKSLSLTYIINQRGDKIVDEDLSFDNGEWMVEGIACHSSMDFGLGTCHCNSHRSTWTKKIDRKKALDLIKKVIKRKQANQSSRDEEIAWLNQAIQETGK